MTVSTSRNPALAGSGDDELAAVGLQELIIGRRLETDLTDVNGLLLLAAGSVLTQDIREHLRARGNKTVYSSKAEVARISLQALGTKPAPTLVFDTELTKKIDSVIDCGLLSVNNRGPAVRDNVVFLGRQGYDTDQRSRLLDQHGKNGKALSTMMSEALSGEAGMDGSLVATMAADYLKEMTTDTDNTLTSAIGDFGSDDLASRSLETALLAMAIAIEMNFDAENVRNVGVAGLVHDWGMMRVPKEIRLAARRLNPVEMLEIKRHPIHSLELLQHVSALPSVIPVVAYQVHERFNGTGYPRGRRGSSIHPFARVLQVADAFVAMTSPRPYRPPMMRYAAMECLVRMAKSRAVDPDVVRSLLKIQSLFPIGSYVVLDNGSIAQVARRNGEKYTQPIVRQVFDNNGGAIDPMDPDAMIDLSDSERTVNQALPTPGSEEVPFNEDYYRSGMEA